MEFNNFLWETYKQSENGKRILYLFKDTKNLFIKEENIFALFDLLNTFKVDKLSKNNFVYFCEAVNFVFTDMEKIFANSILSEDDAYNLLDGVWNLISENDKDKENPPRYFTVDDIELVSSVLYLIAPEYFFPYYFIRDFYYVKDICNEFNIFLPQIPKKNEIEKRFFYYWEICKSVYKFRHQYNISGIELPVFIYGFAINVIKLHESKSNIPKPSRAFFVGGGKKGDGIDSSADFKYLDDANEYSIHNWQGNPNTNPGDIIVMYCLYPRSYIHSIWRAVTPGSIDPFFYFYRNVYIGKPKFINHITLEELKTDPVLSKMSIVKSNMQGINGKIIKKKYYDRILEILENKGTKISDLPKLEDITIDIPELNSEKDIELYLLEPLLKQLGYKEKDWKKQLTLRMGRGEKVFPDYVILPKEEKNNEQGYWVWEAKYSITSNEQLEKDFGQAKSYALRLRCSGLGLISKEGIWLSDNSFNFDKLLYWSWSQIMKSDSIAEIKNMAGYPSKNRL